MPCSWGIISDSAGPLAVGLSRMGATSHSFKSVPISDEQSGIHKGREQQGISVLRRAGVGPSAAPAASAPISLSTYGGRRSGVWE